MRDDGFGADKYFQCNVAENQENGRSRLLNKLKNWGGRLSRNVIYLYLVIFIFLILGTTKLIGYVLYYYIYSTWEGKCLYMEDLYVSPEYRGRGVGSKLMGSVCKVRDEHEDPIQ